MDTGNIHILLIEDNEGDADLLRRLLLREDRASRFTVSHAQRLSEGLKQLQERSFDIVLVDLGLPDSQGIESALRVRKQSEVVPIIVLTGLEDEETALKVLQKDIQDYLVKDRITGNMLIRSIRYAIGRKLAERRLAVQYAVVRLLAEAATAGEVIPAILKIICEHGTWDVGEIWLIDTGSGTLRLGGVWHRPDQELSEFKAISLTTRFHLGRGLPGRVWESAKPVWITEIVDDPSYVRAAEALAAGLHSGFAFPIRSRGEVSGVMAFFSRKVQPQDEDLLKMFDALGSQIGDFRARKHAEEEAKRYSAELERSNKDLQLFASMASHDLQEPLRVISGFAALLERRYKGRLDKKAEDFISHILDGTSRMQQLIRDLLDYSRVSSHVKPFTPVACDKVLEKALLNLKTAIEESGATITSDPLPLVTADESQLVHLFQNLIGNAIKYRREKESPRIHIHAKNFPGMGTPNAEIGSESPAIQLEPGDPQPAMNKMWQFSVEDNGIGIAPAHFKNIFEAFQRLHKREEYPGTGIGLAICKRIANRHGGDIWVESTEGRGSIFYFTLYDQAVVAKPVDAKLVA